MLIETRNFANLNYFAKKKQHEKNHYSEYLNIAQRRLS